MPNLKMSKRELRLLGVLAIVCVLALFYFMVYTKQVAAIDEKKISLEEKEMQLESLVMRINKGKTYEQEIKTYNDLINDLSPKFYGELSQEAFMMIVNERIKESALEATSLTFNDTSYPLVNYLGVVSGVDDAAGALQAGIMSDLGIDEAFLTDIIYTKESSISFTGDYHKLRKFLAGVDSYKKHINIDSVNITSTDGENVTGQIVLSASNLPSLDENITDYYEGNYFNSPSTHEIYQNIFEHYPYYVEMQNKLKAETVNSIENSASSDTVPVNPSSYYPSFSSDSSEESDQFIQDGKPISNDEITVLTNFDQALNFIPNNPDIKGSLSKSTDALEGDSSLKVTYLFNDFTLTNQASIVFAEQSVMNAAFAEYIRMGVKYNTANNNALKATLVGADGNIHEIEFEEVPDDREWHYTYASIPREVKYPFMIKRIYAESIDVQQTMSVELLVDQLSVVSVRQKDVSGEEDDQFEVEESLEDDDQFEVEESLEDEEFEDEE